MLPTYDDVVSAAQRLDGTAHRTPVLTSRLLDAELGAEVFFKSGNHAQAVALSAAILDIPATIVMPLDAPASRWPPPRRMAPRS